MKKNILILGADGMVGKTIFTYLHSLYPDTVWGTTRRKKNKIDNYFFFTVENYHKNFSRIRRKIKRIDYLINCVGVLKNNSPREDLLHANALLPHFLEKLIDEYQCKLIHISTDAVFSPLAGVVNETSSAGPIDYYGCSKFLGETISKNALTFRTSFLGLNPEDKKGLLEDIKKSKKVFNGYVNQTWTGCTTLQFAKLCDEIIKNNLFSLYRKESSVIHFAPLGPVTKYKIASVFAKLIKKPILIKKTKGEKRRRILQTNYIYLPLLNQYNNNIKIALQELIDFES